jgi:PD-(D/E)XK nuclease superfamily
MSATAIDPASLIVEGEIVEREIEGLGTLRFEELGPGEWLTQKGEPAKKARRRYALNGDEFISVSSITGTLEKPALYAWYEDHGARGGAEAQKRGELDGVEPQDIVKRVRALELGAEKQRDEAAERGTAIHKAFEKLAKTGEAPKFSDYPAEWKPWVMGAAKAWLLMDPEPEEAERIVCNPARRYAGRPDLICRIKGRRTLLDYKTGKGRIYEQAHYQTRLYDLALEPSMIEPVEDIIIVGISDDPTAEPELVHCTATELDALGLLSVHLSRKRILADMAAQRAVARKAARA